jgi:16S rRNA (uracil1498-N3)-methyltransferase
MPRFFVDKANIGEDKINIAGDDVKHIKNVLRMHEGESIQLCDSEGMDYECVIEEFQNNLIICGILSKDYSITEPKVKITLFQGMPKGDKFEHIIQKCIELGVAEIIPVMTQRTIVKFDNDKDIEKKTARYNKIALEAGKQSNRGIIPVVSKPVKIKEAIGYSSNFDLKLIPYENEKHNRIKNVINNTSKSDYTTIAVFIGPEGGFDEEEIKAAIEAGIVPVTLGKRILRTETAGPAVLAMLLFALDEI